VDFLQKQTQLVVSQHRLLQQVLLGKMQYSQVRPDYCHGRSTKDAPLCPTVSCWLPHCVPHAFVALFDGLRWRHLLHTRQTTRQQTYSYGGTRLL
jgi:hypothetical protein